MHGRRSRQPARTEGESGTVPQVRTRYVVILAAPGTQILDVTGPFQVFARAAEVALSENPSLPTPYCPEVVTTRRGLLTTCSGLRLEGHRSIHEVRAKIDTLLVAGGRDIEQGAVPRGVVEWLRKVSRSTRRIGSVCTGAFLLAEAGLLNARTATTHWKYCERLAEMYPEVRVETDPIFIRAENTYTSAGVTAGMDLALALVEEDMGLATALRVARELVLYLRRPGGQSQFSVPLILQASDKEPFRDLATWVIDRLKDDLSVEALARHMFMSPRNFSRLFSQEFSITPARFVERVRLEAACRRLQESGSKLEAVAADCGFRSADVMRSVFRRVLNTSPKQYRSRFGSLDKDSTSRPR